MRTTPLPASPNLPFARVLSDPHHTISSYPSTHSEPSIRDTPASTQPQSILAAPPPSKEKISRQPLETCPFCSDSFGTPQALARHKSSRHSFPCRFDGCDEVLSTKRGRDRHHESQKHLARPTLAYRCRCGKKDMRKDLHRRHLSTCRRVAVIRYDCRCDVHCTAEKDEHETHVQMCRPREGQSSTNPTGSGLSGRHR